jgi:hypothetical protein
MVKNSTYKYTFFFIVAFYCLILSQYGLENFDTGFISSFSWRIINGQNAYQDFIYKFPPTSIFLHAFFMKIFPETGQFILFRIIFYFQFSIQVYFVVSGFYNFYEIQKTRINKWGIMSVCFVISLLNFPPIPWPTTDGLFMVSVAFFIVSKYKKMNFISFFLVALFCTLSALSKQSFYLVPLIFTVWVFLRFGAKKSLFFLMLIILNCFLFLNILLTITTWSNFIKQTTGETTLYQLFYTGIHNYVFIDIRTFILILIVILTTIILYLFGTNQKKEVLYPLLKNIAISIMLVSIAFLLFKKAEIGSRLSFWACVFGVTFVYLKKEKSLTYLMPILIILSISWSTSISLGYPFPILFATGIIMSFITLFIDEIKINPKYYFLLLFPVVLSAFSYNIRPYREKNILSLNYDLEIISPKLKYIKTNQEYFEKYTELKKLVIKYGENFIVAPSFPMANYIFNNTSELPADWLINTEINKRPSMFLKLASNKKNYIFLEKSFLNHEEFVPKYIENFSYISYYVYKNFNKIGETNHFIVYNGLKK